MLVLSTLACGPVSQLAPTPELTSTPPPKSIIIVISSPMPGLALPTSTLRPVGTLYPTGTLPLTSIPTSGPAPTRPPLATPVIFPTEPPPPVLIPTSSPTFASRPTQIATLTPMLMGSPTATSLPIAGTRTSTPTATSTPSGQSTLTPTPVAVATVQNQALIPSTSVRVYTTSITIPTYDYENALVATQQGDPIYPYPSMNFAQVATSPTSKSYRAVVLENAYVRVTILPELGGRVYSWVDKAQTPEKAIAYSNPVIKPVDGWGYRKWWLATGGIEWCLPTDEHGLNEYRPWQVTLNSTSVTVKDHEDQTGLDVQVTLSLDSAHNYLIIQPKVTNSTGSSQSFKFWLNAMLAFANNHVSDDTYFIMPGVTQATIHSTGDTGLPASGAIGWPTYNGRDLSMVGNLNGYLGIFANPSAGAGFAGAYDTTADFGIVRIFPSGTATGVKFFTPRGIGPSKWTDDGSNYFELWGGLEPTFADQATLASGSSVGWTEQWYPINGLQGSYDYANDKAALRILNDPTYGVVVRLAASTNLENALVKLWQNGQVVMEWQTSLGPGRPISARWQRPAGSCSGDACNRLGVQLLDSAGAVLAQTGTLQ